MAKSGSATGTDKFAGFGATECDDEASGCGAGASAIEFLYLVALRLTLAHIAAIHLQ